MINGELGSGGIWGAIVIVKSTGPPIQATGPPRTDAGAGIGMRRGGSKI